MSGHRSLLAPWMGGASAAVQTAGVRSMLAFWMGGGQWGDVQAPALSVVTGGWGEYRKSGRKETEQERLKRIYEERIRLGILEQLKQDVPKEQISLDVDPLVHDYSGVPLTPSEIKTIKAKVYSQWRDGEIQRLIRIVEKQREEEEFFLLLMSLD